MQINEIYQTFQGEGVWTGIPMTLVRVQGCNGKCPFCDTLQAMNSKAGLIMTPEEVVAECDRLHGETTQPLNTYRRRNKYILLTGGEPGLVGVKELEVFYLEARLAGWTIHVETNGTLPLWREVRPDWICVSPKLHHTPELDLITIHTADEVKCIYEGAEGEEELLDTLRWGRVSWDKVCIQPLWAGSVLRNAAIDFAMRYGFRISLQMHKFAGRS